MAMLSLWATTATAQTAGYNTNFDFSLHNFVDTIPIEIVDDQIYVDVTMDGRRMRLNLDTGSGQGVVYGGTTMPRMEELGNVVSRDGAGNLDTVRVVALPPFTMGRLTVSHYVASVMERQTARRDADAILGFDIFNKGLSCKIDTRRKMMVVTDRRDFFDREPGYRLKYKLKWFVPYVLVSPFKRHTDEVLFDTGSRRIFAMNKASFDKHAYKSKNVESQVEHRITGAFAIGHHGAEETAEVVFMKMDRLRWDKFDFKNVRATTTQGASRIGTQMLHYGSIIINGPRRTLTFQPYDGVDSVEVGNEHPRIAYVPREGRATVGLVLEDSPEYRAGLRQGDTIVAADGHAIDSFDNFLSYPFVVGRAYRLLVRTKEGRMKEVMFVR